MTTAEDLLASARTAIGQGETARAAALCRDALAHDPARAGAWVLLGVALRRDDPAGAETALRRAVTLAPGDADAHFHLGNLLREHARWTEAVAAYRAALRKAPQHASLLNNLGLALAGAGDAAAAEAAFREVLVKQPTHPQALANLAHVLCGKGRYAEAAALAARALASDPRGSPDLHVDHGIALRELGDAAAAAGSFRRALALVPDDAVALVNLGTVLAEMGDFQAALPVLERARVQRQDDANVLTLLAHVRQQLCAWHGLDSLHGAALAALRTHPDTPVNPFHLLAMPVPAAVQQHAARSWAARLPADAAPALIAHGGDRLRVAYVSSDFRMHALAFLATEVWERHDRHRVTPLAYALAPPDTSAVRARIARAFETFRDLHAADDQAIVETIRADAPDVVIDLNGYTTHARSAVFARRVAPVQLQWLGYLGTMGASWMDGILTDEHVAPPAMQQVFDERLVYLPDCYCPSDTRRAVAVPPDRASCGLPDKALVLCCFNAPYKILPEVFAVWMRLLHAAPGTVLWLSPSGATEMRNLLAAAHAHGIDAGRLRFAPRVAVDAHLARHVHADLYLDTIPYNAGTAANDALFMNVPVLTCTGATMAGRVAGSQLRAIGLPELVTPDLATYEQQALELVRDPARLHALRETLRRNRAEWPLFDMARFTKALEATLATALQLGG